MSLKNVHVGEFLDLQLNIQLTSLQYRVGSRREFLISIGFSLNASNEEGYRLSKSRNYKFYVFVLCIVIKLYNTNQRNVQFYKSIFNFWYLLHVSNLIGSSSGWRLHMQYGMFYMHRREQYSGQDSVYVKHTILHIQHKRCLTTNGLDSI
jgi:hypothetical protein